MWPINYDSLSKFHISIGIGMIVAGFLFYLVAISQYFEYIDTLNDDLESLSNMPASLCESGQENSETCHLYLLRVNLTNTKATFFAKDMEDRFVTFNYIMYGGMAIFLLGYGPWYFQEIKKWHEEK